MSTGASTAPLPRLPTGPLNDEIIREWAERLTSHLEDSISQLSQSAGTGWQATNFTKLRVFNAGIATLTDTKNVLATLIDDLKLAQHSVIGG